MLWLSEHSSLAESMTEEKLRMETRRDFMKEHFGEMQDMSRRREEWCGYGCLDLTNLDLVQKMGKVKNEKNKM